MAIEIGFLLRNARLPSPAPVVLSLYEALDNGSAEDIARIIEADPALAVRLLRLANSAFYAPSPVTTVRDAIVRVGTMDVAALGLASEVMRIFRGIPKGQFSMRDFWEHSLWTACYSEALAPSGSQRQSAPMWLCGLIHDVGKLLLARNAPAEYAEVLDRVGTDGVLLDVERETLGFTHAQAGAELLKTWRLPTLLVESTARHHEPYVALDAPWAIVAAANDVANETRDLKDLQGMTPESMQQVETEARERHASFRQLFTEDLR
jgi:putative nucleotidyltransferase with HDIG domain